MSKVIDFFAARGARVTDVHTHPNRYGSDHHPVICHIAGSTNGHRWEYVVATWNVERDRTPAAVMIGVDALFHAGVDVILAQECDGYFHVFAHEYAGRIVHLNSRPGQAEAAVIVAPGLTITFPSARYLTRTGWITVRGGRHPAQSLATCLIDSRLRVASGHMPVSVRWVKGIPIGPPMRLAGWLQAARFLPRFAHSHRRHPLIVGQDWNARPDQTGKASPARICAAAGLTIHAPTTPTHA